MTANPVVYDITKLLRKIPSFSPSRPVWKSVNRNLLSELSKQLNNLLVQNLRLFQNTVKFKKRLGIYHQGEVFPLLSSGWGAAHSLQKVLTASAWSQMHWLATSLSKKLCGLKKFCINLAGKLHTRFSRALQHVPNFMSGEHKNLLTYLVESKPQPSVFSPELVCCS